MDNNSGTGVARLAKELSRRRWTRREWLSSCTRLFASGITACSVIGCNRSPAQLQRNGSTVTVLYSSGERTVFAPADAAQAQFLVFMPLVSWNRHGELEGRLAERWEPSPDFGTWTIMLRDGLRWQDGVPVTAHDVKFTYDLLMRPEADQYAPDSYAVTVLDDLTYRIKLTRQDLNTVGALDDTIAIWPKHLLEKLDPEGMNNWDFWSRPVGCGPYRHVRTVPETMMEFEANPDYFRGPPKIERVILKFADGTAMPELLSGNVDAAPWHHRADILAARRNRQFQVYQQQALFCAAIWWNSRHPLFQDSRVRRALTLAINRRELMQLFNLPGESPVVDFVFTNRQLRRGDFADPIPHDPYAANQLLDSAGWLRNGKGLRVRDGRPFHFTLTNIQDVYSEGDDASIYVQDQLKRVGIHMDFRPDPNVWPRIKSGDFEAIHVAFDGYSDLDQSLRGAGYGDPKFFEILERARTTFDPVARDRLYRELTTVFSADVPVTMLFPYGDFTIASKRIRGLDDSPYRGDLTRCMDELWLEEQT